ncbi:outer membrane beta-barrel protein [Croceimicrobium sp.]|uniref:outer membrane beta-barrel protein n=1 Tax=Croceimicrobium sp. TaxID=2828340 RepID=UPI003BAC99FD
MRLALLFLVLPFFAWSQTEYIGYEDYRLQQMLEESIEAGDSLNAHKTMRYIEFTRQLDDLEFAFQESYKSPRTDADLKAEIEKRLNALSRLNLAGQAYRYYLEEADESTAKDSLNSYFNYLEQLGLDNYFLNLFDDLQDNSDAEMLVEDIEEEEDQISTVWDQKSFGGYSDQSRFDYRFQLGLVYNYFHFSDTSQVPPEINLQWSKKGSTALVLNIGASYKINSKLSVFSELGYSSSQLEYQSEFTDPWLGETFINGNEYSFSHLDLIFGAQYKLADKWQLALGIAPSFTLKSEAINFQENLDGTRNYGSLQDLKELEWFRSTQFRMLFEVAYLWRYIEVSDYPILISPYFRPMLSASSYRRSDVSIGPNWERFSISQFHLGIRISY